MLESLYINLEYEHDFLINRSQDSSFIKLKIPENFKYPSSYVILPIRNVTIFEQILIIKLPLDFELPINQMNGNDEVIKMIKWHDLVQLFDDFRIYQTNLL